MFQKNRDKSIHYRDRRRLLILSSAIFALFSFLVIQFYKIQILDGEKWTKLANTQHKLCTVEPFKRGVFYSSGKIKEGHPDKPQPLVIDVPKFHLYIDPMMLPSDVKSEICSKLLDYFVLDHKERDKFKEQFEKSSRSRQLKRWIDHEIKSGIMSWWQPYAKKRKIPANAVYFLQEYHRQYPFGSLLGSVLHTVRETRDEATHQGIPTGGLELYFNKYLEGKEGKRLLLRSPKRPLDAGKMLIPPEHGADIYLTINHCLQAIAEEEIAKAIKQTNATAGWAVLMDPHTGEIVALAQYPPFFPEHYAQYFNDPSLEDLAQVKGVVDCFEPGSTMKPINAAIGLLANEVLEKEGKPPLVHPLEKVAVYDGNLPGRKKPMKDVGSYRFLNFNLALQKSSNIYFAKFTQKTVDTFGANWYLDKLQSIFGFGELTGIELPSESRGFLPTPGKKYPNGCPEWSTPTPGVLAIGYNALTTSIQLLRAYAVIANGGYRVEPTLLNKIVKGEETIFANNFERSKERVLSLEICNAVRDGLKFVTKTGGSSSRADIHGFTEAGKSGTSEKVVRGKYSKKDHFSSFVGFAPAHGARFVLFVGINEPSYQVVPGFGKSFFGGKCAAPVFKNIMERSLKFLGIEPDDPYGYPKGDPRANEELADYSQEIKDLKKQFHEWN